MGGTPRAESAVVRTDNGPTVTHRNCFSPVALGHATHLCPKSQGLRTPGSTRRDTYWAFHGNPPPPPPPGPDTVRLTWFGIENKDALMPSCGVHYLWFAFVCFLIRSPPPPPGSRPPGSCRGLGSRTEPKCPKRAALPCMCPRPSAPQRTPGASTTSARSAQERPTHCLYGTPVPHGAAGPCGNKGRGGRAFCIWTRIVRMWTPWNAHRQRVPFAASAASISPTTSALCPSGRQTSQPQCSLRSAQVSDVIPSTARRCTTRDARGGPV